MRERSSMKQVIIIRKDLNMDPGKVISQACHACLEASEEAKKLDADAIVGVRFTTSSVIGGAAELLAYGTAVKLK